MQIVPDINAIVIDEQILSKEACLLSVSYPSWPHSTVNYDKNWTVQQGFSDRYTERTQGYV